jgi:hypothetical protein
MSNAITPDQIPDRRDQIPLGDPAVGQRGKEGDLDDAVNRIVEEQGDLLTNTNAGVSGDRDGKNQKKGIVFANSHNDEMQKEPFVSIDIQRGEALSQPTDMLYTLSDLVDEARISVNGSRYLARQTFLVRPPHSQI